MQGASLHSQVLRPTSYGKWVGGPMSLKGGNFSFQARTDQNQPRMDKYGTYLDFNASQGAPKHCPTLDSLTQCFASAHFRSPPGASGSLREPPILFATIFHLWFLSNSETIFLLLFSGKGRVKREGWYTGICAAICCWWTLRNPGFSLVEPNWFWPMVLA